MKWIDCSKIYISGKLFKDSKPYYRLNDKYLDLLTKVDKTYERGNNPSGLYINFRTNTNNLSVKWKLKELHVEGYTNINTQGGLDVYIQQGKFWKFISNASPEFPKTENEVVIFNEDKFKLFINQTNTFSLNLPIYEELLELYIGIDDNATFEAIENNNKPIICYGTSITHGACAGRPGLTWGATFRYLTNENVINFAFGGGGRLDKEAVDILCEFHPKLQIIEPFANMKYEMVEERLIYFYNTYRETHKETPILFIELMPILHYSTISNEIHPINLKLRELFNKWKKTDKNIYKLDSENTFSPQDTMDNIHPNDIGMATFANNIYNKYKEIFNIKE